MTNKRFLMFAVLVGLFSVVAMLYAAKGTGTGEPAQPPAERVNGKRLVCIGFVDTRQSYLKLFPDNFPQPSKALNVLVKTGEEVKAGQSLLTMDKEHAEMLVAQATTALELAKVDLVKAEAGLKVFDASMNAAKFELQAREEDLKNRKAEFEDTRRLLDLQQKSKAEYEAALASIQSAERMIDSARWKQEAVRLQSPQPTIDSAKLGVKHKEQQLAQAKLALKYLDCKAPSDGVILRSFVHDGITFGPHTREPAFWFLPKQALIVRIEISQEFSSRVKMGMIAIIEDEEDPSVKWKGKVTFVANEFLPKRPTNAQELLTMTDERVLECHVEVDPAEQMPKFGQKLRVTLEE
ncbi:MAG: hypothetical protein R3B84_20100 [Zavarzinella sp.]